MTDYTQVRMRIAWVVLASLLTVASTASEAPKTPTTDLPLPAAALTIARALNVEPLPSDPSGRSSTQEVQIGDTTLIVRRRSKTPHSLDALPKPVFVTSVPLSVKSKEDANSRSGRKIELGADGIPVVHGVRTPDEPADKYFTWRNARVIKGVLTPYDSRDSRAQKFPSPIKISQDQIPSEIVVKSRQARVLSSDVIRPTVLDQGATAVRAPVLQYAHPELGAQPALSSPASQSAREASPTAQAVVYFARDNPQDIHNDHSPYPFEPAEIMQMRQHEEPALQRPYDKRYQQYELKIRPKKTAPYQFNDGQDSYTKYKQRPQYNNNNNFNSWNKESRYKYLPEYDQVSYATYYSPDDSKPFWERLSEVIRDNVQSGVAKMTDLARPMVDPLMTASQAISENLGLTSSRSGAQEKVGIVGPLLGGAHAFMPAIGLMAGGAALGFGAATMGRYLEHTQVVGAKARNRRALLTGGKPIAALQENGDEERYLDNVVHSLESAQDSFLARLSRYGHQSWSEDTPCAKRIFCDVMTQQPEDAVILMEKKMGTFLSLVNPGVARALADHMGEVMDAVRRRDCSPFSCAAENMQRRFAVSGAAVEAPGRGGPR